ncbi:MAG: hypothetical protein EPO24_12465 [Bacteroidetes bacterium]|nr:MAG: hypothetical protein EPO24_12465 [Bacteroidota bacterium]
MKQLSILILVALVAVLAGCSKDDAVNTPVTDDQAIQEMVVSDESVSDFSQSEETTISDDEEFEWSKYGFDETMTQVKVFRWGRRVVSVDRNVTVMYVGDTLAVALLTKMLNGNLVIAASYSDTAHLPDTLIRKPFHERLQRKIVFARIGTYDNPRQNWKAVAISLVEGGIVPDTLNKFDIESLAFISSSDTATITDPLNTWLRFGAQRDRVPIVHRGDSILIRMTLTSADDSAEAVVIRWTGESTNNDVIARMRMRLVSTTGGPGAYERVYEMKIRAHLRLGRPFGRFNVVTDVHSWGTLNDDAQPVSNRLWGFPYDVRP